MDAHTVAIKASEMSELLDSLTVVVGGKFPPEYVRREVMSVARRALKLYQADLDAANERAKWMRRAHDAKVVIQAELERQLYAANKRITELEVLVLRGNNEAYDAACEAVREKCDHLPEYAEAPCFDGALCQACRDAIAAIEKLKGGK